ncbi:MAG: hypothetical protein IJ504_00950 [Bacteroidales bacterium]|nr:hypothetical protein [Bacteroidales bacterium]
MKPNETVIYAFPIDMHRNISDNELVAAYENNVTVGGLPILRMTPEEFAEKINDDMFNDQEYYVRAITAPEEPFCMQENRLRQDIISEIIRTLKKENMESMTFSRNSEDFTEIVWFDRHDFANNSRIDRIKICGTELEIVTDEGVSLFTHNDYGAYNISTLNGILDNVVSVIKDHFTAKAISAVGAFLHERGVKTVHFEKGSYDLDTSMPHLFIEGERQKLKWIRIDKEGAVIEVGTETADHQFDIREEKDASLAFVENSLREMGLEDVLEEAYSIVQDHKDEPFDYFLQKQIK